MHYFKESFLNMQKIFHKINNYTTSKTKLENTNQNHSNKMISILIFFDHIIYIHICLGRQDHHQENKS